MMNENCDNLTTWIENATEKLASIKQLYNHSLACWREVQDKYAPESLDNKELFINGVSVSIPVSNASTSPSESKDKQE